MRQLFMLLVLVIGLCSFNPVCVSTDVEHQVTASVLQCDVDAVTMTDKACVDVDIGTQTLNFISVSNKSSNDYLSPGDILSQQREDCFISKARGKPMIIRLYTLVDNNSLDAELSPGFYNNVATSDKEKEYA